MTRTVRQVQQAGLAAGCAVRDLARAIKGRLQHPGKGLKQPKEQRQETRASITADVLGMAEAVLQEVAAFRAQAVQEAQRRAGALGKRLQCGLSQLDTWLERTQRVVQQTRQVLAGNPHIKNRLVSLFDPDARPIRKGKLKAPTEFGYKVVVADEERGFITYYAVTDGNPEDSTLLEAAVQRHQEQVGHIPHGVATDRGMASAGNERKLHQRGGVRCSLPKTGPKTASEQAKEDSWWFRHLQRFRADGEARISLLKRKYGWRRSLQRGQDGVKNWVGWGAITRNLTRYGRLQATAPVGPAAAGPGQPAAAGVSQCSKTDGGAETFAAFVSLCQTLGQRGTAPVAGLTALFRSGQLPLPP